MSGNFVPEVGFEVAGVSLLLGFDPSGQPMMAVGVDKTKNSADKTVAPLDDEAIVRLLAFVNRALVSRLETVKRIADEQPKAENSEGGDILTFKPKG